jgi:hypothetical protein
VGIALCHTSTHLHAHAFCACLCSSTTSTVWCSCAVGELGSLLLQAQRPLVVTSAAAAGLSACTSTATYRRHLSGGPAAHSRQCAPRHHPHAHHGCHRPCHRRHQRRVRLAAAQARACLLGQGLLRHQCCRPLPLRRPHRRDGACGSQTPPCRRRAGRQAGSTEE